MSWRIWQPPAKTASIAAQTPRRMREVLVIMHLGNVVRGETLQKARRLLEMKLLVARLDADEEAVRRGVTEAMRIENGVMRLRQAVEREHPENGRERSTENGQFEGDRDKGRPAIKGAPGNVDGIGVDVRPILEAKAAKAANQAADKRYQRDVVTAHGHGFGHAFDGKRCVAFVEAVAFQANFLGGMHELLRLLKLANQAVNVRPVLYHLCSSDVSVTNSRISAMEIAGKTRTNRKISMVNIPSVPTKVAQSQTVGE